MYQIIPFAKEHDAVLVVSLTKVGFIAVDERATPEAQNGIQWEHSSL